MDYKKLTRIIDSLHGQDCMSDFEKFISEVNGTEDRLCSVVLSDDSDADFVNVTLTNNIEGEDYGSDIEGEIVRYVRKMLPDVEVQETGSHSITISIPKSYFAETLAYEHSYDKLTDVLNDVCLYGFED